MSLQVVSRAVPFRSRGISASAVALAVAALALITPALAHAAAPWWRVESRTAPTYLPPMGTGQVFVYATDVGDAPANGSKAPIKIVDHLPKQLSVISNEGKFEVVAVTYPEVLKGNEPIYKFTCEVTSSSSGQIVTCSSTSELPAYQTVEVRIGVNVEESNKATLANEATVEGGGAAQSQTRGLEVSSTPTNFGIEELEMTPESEGGGRDAQAGSHPYQLETTLNLNESLERDRLKSGEPLYPSSPALLKDLQLKAPPGLIGTANPELVPRCSSHDFSTILTTYPNGEPSNDEWNECPSDTAIGVAVVSVNEPIVRGPTTVAVPVFNLEPSPGEPARFGFLVLGHVATYLDTSVRTGSDYGVNVTVRNASDLVDVLGSEVYLWGDPGNRVHDGERGWACLINGGGTQGRFCEEPNPRPTDAFLSLPTGCGETLHLQALADSWNEPGPLQANGEPVEGDPRWAHKEAEMPPLTGCETLPFGPSISVQPDTGAANTPAGFNVDVHLPQASTLEEDGLAESALRDSSVTLPAGVLLSPSGANGLLTCGLNAVGAAEPPVVNETPQFKPELPENWQLGADFCPTASKVGTVKIKTPDLKGELEGGVYLAAQNANPFGSTFAMYIVAQEPESKVTVKLAGEIKPDPNTGQVTTVFRNTPDVGFEDLKLELTNGSRASLTTPPTCGDYTTTTAFAPWSGNPPQGPQSTFAVTSGAEGSGCANPLPLTPSISAGTPVHQAGAFTPFEFTLVHKDTDQAPTSLTVHLPPGLAGIIKNVELCHEPQAQQGTCPASSLIGHATAVAGLGATPYTATGGQVFLTEGWPANSPSPYKGAPFGLSVVIPANTETNGAPVFTFGNVVTRSALRVDPNTTAVTIESELPTMVRTVNGSDPGVPVQLKEIHVVTDRPEFQFNPTNCTPSTISATVTGAQGGVGGASTPFQVANCSALPFHPEFSAEVNSHYTKNDGTSLVVVVKSAKGQANIGKTKVSFPEQLPSRLTTLQKACSDKVFDVNPASCSPESIIGTAVAHTPVFKNPLSGPAYLVSHGNAKFPDVEFLLQGEGLEVILDGSTDIKNGITTSSFESVPDAPVNEFVVTLPAGPKSAFTGYANLCEPYEMVTSKVRVAKKVGKHHTIHVLKTETRKVATSHLKMPTILTGQNGDVIQETTVIKTSGCGAVASFKAKAKPKKKKAKKKAKKKK